jgi:NAD(P)-dependent dehydrogenase (short-subunit alcohol dehydrogenase family)
MTSPDSQQKFNEKVVLITGGGGGIGKAAAARFLDEGAMVALNSRRQDVLDAAARELDPARERLLLFAGDVSKPQTAQAFVRASVERFGGVDILVNSTGIFRVKLFTDETEEDLEEALSSILRPTFYTAQAAVRAMRERGGGSIVSVGSMWAVDAIATTPTSAYSAAQAGRHALTKNLAIELAPDRIRVNAVALGFVETPAYERFLAPSEARSLLDSLHSFQPLGRHGYPADVVEAILFLAGDDARWITGATLPVDGGVLAGRSSAGAAVAGESAAA